MSDAAGMTLSETINLLSGIYKRAQKYDFIMTYSTVTGIYFCLSTGKRIKQHIGASAATRPDVKMSNILAGRPMQKSVYIDEAVVLLLPDVVVVFVVRLIFVEIRIVIVAVNGKTSVHGLSAGGQHPEG